MRWRWIEEAVTAGTAEVGNHRPWYLRREGDEPRIVPEILA
jgi:hypothetical protein